LVRPFGLAQFAQRQSAEMIRHDTLSFKEVLGPCSDMPQEHRAPYDST
jgi:hypothetical protein